MEWRVNVPPPFPAFLMEIGRQQRETEPLQLQQLLLVRTCHPRHPHLLLGGAGGDDGKDEELRAESITGWESGY